MTAATKRPCPACGSTTYDTYYFGGCSESKPLDQFPGGTSYGDVRANGVHNGCRACQTRARRDYRRRHRAEENAYQRAYKKERRGRNPEAVSPTPRAEA